MTRIARSTLFDLPILSLDEMLEKVDSVSVADVEELAGELFSQGRMSAAGIGRDEDCFRGALAPVEEALAA
jgi:predicted Zn-dependent peptidase